MDNIFLEESSQNNGQRTNSSPMMTNNSASNGPISITSVSNILVPVNLSRQSNDSQSLSQNNAKLVHLQRASIEKEAEEKSPRKGQKLNPPSVADFHWGTLSSKQDEFVSTCTSLSAPFAEKEGSIRQQSIVHNAPFEDSNSSRIGFVHVSEAYRASNEGVQSIESSITRTKLETDTSSFNMGTRCDSSNGECELIEKLTDDGKNLTDLLGEGIIPLVRKLQFLEFDFTELALLSAICLFSSG